MLTVNDTQINIATITLCCKIPDCDLNITNIGQYLQIDDKILGIKYKYGDLNIMKGMYSTTIYKKSKGKKLDKVNKRLFYNQVSIIVNNGDKSINVKVFKNGSLHMTGCKSEDDAYKVLKILLEKFKNMETTDGHIILLTQDEHGVLLDNNNIMYSYSGHQIIGYKLKTGVYVIDKKQYKVNGERHVLIYGKQESQRKKEILNFDGVLIGYSNLELLNNRTKFYKKNFEIHYDYNSGFIYANDNVIIGKINYTVDKSLIIDPNQHSEVIEVDYKTTPYKSRTWECLDFDSTTYKQVFDVNVNCINICFNLNFKLNRNKLYDCLIHQNYLCKYRPEAYSGIKFVYKVPMITSDFVFDGHCHCTYKCYCRSITFLIFQSGNVIATGFKNLNEVHNITPNLFDIIQPLKEIVQQKQVVEN